MTRNWLAGDPVTDLENFTDAVEEVLTNCGRMPPYRVDLSYDCAVNQICLIDDRDNGKPNRVLITIEEV